MPCPLTKAAAVCVKHSHGSLLCTCACSWAQGPSFARPRVAILENVSGALKKVNAGVSDDAVYKARQDSN